MKTDRSCFVSGTSLLVSSVCLIGLLHVEYKLYINEYMNTECVQTTRNVIKTKSKENLKEEDNNPREGKRNRFILRVSSHLH